MKKILTVSLAGLFTIISGSWGDFSVYDKTVIAPGAVEAALTTLQTDSQNKQIADLFDIDKFVEALTRIEPIYLYRAIRYCPAVLNLKKDEIDRLYIKQGDAITDTDINGFCDVFVKNIIKHHNAIVQDKRHDYLHMDIVPREGAKKVYTHQGDYYASQIDVDGIDVSEIMSAGSAEYLSGKLDSTYAVFDATNDSLVCVLDKVDFGKCKPTDNGLLFAVQFVNREEGMLEYFSEQDIINGGRPLEAYGLSPESYKKVPVGRKVFDGLIQKLISLKTNDGSRNAHIATPMLK